MVKPLFLALLLLGVCLLILSRAFTVSTQVAEKRNVANGQVAKQANPKRAVEAIATKRPDQGPGENKKAPGRQMNLTVPLEKLLQNESKPRLPTTNPPTPAKVESGTGDDEFGSILPNGLPLWFRVLDKDEDGQIALHEWLEGGKSLEEFRRFDRNGDGLMTAEEVLLLLKKSDELKLVKGQASHNGAIELTDEKYNGNKLSKIFTIKFDKGKTYQIDHMSKAFDAFLYLEDPDGKLVAENDDGGEGTNSRIVHKAAQTGAYRIVVTSLGGTRPGAFSLLVRVIDEGTLSKGLPAWFKELDRDGDGQVGLYEWRESGKTIDEFRTYDLNGDGLITAEELLNSRKMFVDLKLENGHADYRGEVEEFIAERYQGKKSFKILSIQLEKGKTYQIEGTSEAFSAYLYLEDSNHKILTRHNSGGSGSTAHFQFHAAKAGLYRIIATSQDGNQSGEFSLSVRVLDSFVGVLPKGLPSWFKELDKDGDGQIGLYEWRESGKTLEEFLKLDLDGDGFIQAEEVLRHLKMPTELRIQKNQAVSNGTIQTTDEKYGGDKLAKVFTVKLEKGKTYQIDHMSKEFGAYLYLEDSEGNVLDKIHSGGKGLTARIVHLAASTGTYRVIATSQEGNKTGAFSISVRAKDN